MYYLSLNHFRLIWMTILYTFTSVCVATTENKNEFIFITYEAEPWQSTEFDGSVTGMVPFILKNMGDATGYTLHSRSYPYARISRQIKLGDADLVISMTNSRTQNYTVPCVKFGSFTVVAFTKNQPFLKRLKHPIQNKPSVGILNDSFLAFKELIPEHINRHWQMKEYSTETAIFNAVNKGRLDVGFLSLNTYQLLLDNLSEKEQKNSFMIETGYGKVTGWLPIHLKHSAKHIKMCEALNKISDNGQMILDSDAIIDSLITQETPDITKTPRLTPADIHMKNILPELLKIYAK